MNKVLLLENIHPVASEVFARNGFTVETRSHSLSEDELIETLPGFSMVGLRSNTKLTARVIENAPDLKAVGAFCIGTNQIDLDAAAARGIAAFNAPYSNTRSVVELVIGEIIALARLLPAKTQKMHAGVWDKSAAGSHEVRGRTLGIVGYGNIGTQLSNLAEALGLRVIFYDTADRLAHGNARRVGTMEQLLEESDVVSLHVDGRPGNAGLFGDAQFRRMKPRSMFSNAGLFGDAQFRRMKPRSMFINASRGMVVDDVALREHILSGHIAGAALDVFPVEPKAQGDPFESALRGLDNVILTPHVGGSTQEAQEEIGYFVAGKLTAFATAGSTALSVNLPEVQTAPLHTGYRLAYLHHSVPGVLAGVNQVLAQQQANVVAQGLSTRGEQGYVVTDLDAPLTDIALKELEAAAETIWLRTFHA